MTALRAARYPGRYPRDRPSGANKPWEDCANTAASNDPRIQHVRITEDGIIAHLADGRIISVPLAWSWRLSEATPKQRVNLRLIGSGQGVLSDHEPPNKRVQPTRGKRRVQAGSRDARG